VRAKLELCCCRLFLRMPQHSALLQTTLQMSFSSRHCDSLSGQVFRCFAGLSLFSVLSLSLSLYIYIYLRLFSGVAQRADLRVDIWQCRVYSSWASGHTFIRCSSHGGNWELRMVGMKRGQRARSTRLLNSKIGEYMAKCSRIPPRGVLVDFVSSDAL